MGLGASFGSMDVGGQLAKSLRGAGVTLGLLASFLTLLSYCMSLSLSKF